MLLLVITGTNGAEQCKDIINSVLRSDTGDCATLLTEKNLNVLYLHVLC